jgi:hypothetical protein
LILFLPTIDTSYNITLIPSLSSFMHINWCIIHYNWYHLSMHNKSLLIMGVLIFISIHAQYCEIIINHGGSNFHGFRGSLWLWKLKSNEVQFSLHHRNRRQSNLQTLMGTGTNVLWTYFYSSTPIFVVSTKCSFWSCIPYKKFESKNLNGLGWNRNASYFFSTWMEIGQSEDRILISINLWM